MNTLTVIVIFFSVLLGIAFLLSIWFFVLAPQIASVSNNG